MGSGSGPIGFGGQNRRAFHLTTAGRARAPRPACARCSPGLAGARVEHAWGGPIDVSADHLPCLRAPCPARGSTTAPATPETASARAGSAARSSPRSRSGRTTIGRGCRSSTRRSGSCRRSRSTTSAAASCGRRCSRSRRRRRPGATPRRRRARRVAATEARPSSRNALRSGRSAFFAPTRYGTPFTT